MVCFQSRSLLIGNVWVPVMHFCACCIHCKVHLRVGRRLESFRLISAQPLKIGPINSIPSGLLFFRARFTYFHFYSISACILTIFLVLFQSFTVSIHKCTGEQLAPEFRISCKHTEYILAFFARRNTPYILLI